MSHISFSELKNWVRCPYYHKLIHIDKLKGFVGNEFTAFGTAIHTVCEKKLLKEDIDDERVFVDSFSDNIADLGDDVSVDRGLVDQMVGQGKAILPEVEEALVSYFGYDFEVFSTEERIYEPMEGLELKFKGFIDAVIKTPDGKYHIVDWKTCSWGWDARKRSDPMVTYQLTLYKNYFAKKHNIDPKIIETHFALLKRTAKKDRVEFFRVTSGPIKMANALKLLKKAVYNIEKKNTLKNRTSCRNCEFYRTEHCK
tara:strand:+ start:189 stop:953 length:765 start_codon:yes stop_codon:yes gene_type:complete